MPSTSPAHNPHIKYRPDIDGLRAVAVLAVVAFHGFPAWMQGGFIGVDVFFVISGFLISKIIFENLDKGTFSFTNFYSRRIRRIFPALIVVLAACLAFGWFVLLADELNQLGSHIAAGAAFYSNLILWHEAGYFDNAASTKPLLHLWSLGIEEQFYIAWPLLLWLAWKVRFNRLLLIAGIVLLSFYLNMAETSRDLTAAFYSPLTRIWELLCGSILAWLTLYNFGEPSERPSRINTLIAMAVYRDNGTVNRTLSNTMSLLGSLLLAYGFLVINDTMDFPGTWAMVPVAGTSLLLMAGPDAWINKYLLSNKIAIWFGLISFPLYLWHWPIISFATILKSGAPGFGIVMTGIAASIVLAWLTMVLVEQKLRFGKKHVTLKVTLLCASMVAIGLTGAVVGQADFSDSHQYHKLAIKRKNFEHAIKSSLAWYHGKNNWLFLGNQYDGIVAKIKLAVYPDEREIEQTERLFASVAVAGMRANTRVVLFMGPNKSSIYPEHLPDWLVPSTTKHSSFYINRLKNLGNLTAYDPTSDLLEYKKTEGLLYWKTDTHWNPKGAYLAYKGLLKKLALPFPQVEFQKGPPTAGDLVEISKLSDHPLDDEDSWTIHFKNSPAWTETTMPYEYSARRGSKTVVINENPLSDKCVWVVGDSFTNGLKQYFNATFREVHYLGHWNSQLVALPAELEAADKKPDLIVIVRVERTF